MTEFPVAFIKRLPECFHSHLLQKKQILVVIFEREQCELCSLWHFWNICNIWFVLKGKVKDQRQQLKLLSSCCIILAPRNPGPSKGPRSMPGPGPCLSKHPSKRYYTQIVLDAPALVAEWFFSWCLEVSGISSTAGLWCRVSLVTTWRPNLDHEAWNKNSCCGKLTQMVSSSSIPTNTLVFFKRLDARKEGPKVRSPKLVFVVSVQLGFVFFSGHRKTFGSAQALICRQTLAEEISTDNNGGPKRRLVV